MSRSEPAGLLVWRFPLPTGSALITAYNHLNAAMNPSDDPEVKAKKSALGNPNDLPRPWSPGTCTDPVLRRELWEWLDRVVGWINHEFLWEGNAATDVIWPCWPLHPHLVHEIAVLADQRRTAEMDLVSNKLEEWHRYCLRTFLDRMRQRAQEFCTENHVVDPVSVSRYDRHMSTPEVDRRREAFQNDVNAVRMLHPARFTHPARPAGAGGGGVRQDRGTNGGGIDVGSPDGGSQPGLDLRFVDADTIRIDIEAPAGLRFDPETGEILNRPDLPGQG
jgi:hypothetical protein